MADGIGTVALPLLAASLTSSPLLISGLTSLGYLPWLLFGLPGGALVDRLDRKHVMSVANLVRAAVIAVFAVLVLLHVASIPWLYAAAFVAGIGEVLYDSAARAMLPQVLARQQLDRGNSWLTTEETVGQSFLGAPAGSGLFALQAAAPFVTNAVGFAVSGFVVLAIPGRFRPERTRATTLRAEISDGMRWLWRHPLLRDLTIYRGVTAALMSMATSLTVLYVLRSLHVSAGFYGLFMVAVGVGGVLGAVVVGPLTARLGRIRVLWAAAACGPAMCLLLGVFPELWAAGLLFVGLSAGVTVWNVLSMSLRQAMIPDEYLGRVLSAYRMALWGGVPVGALLGGLVASATSVPRVFLISGAAQMAVALLTYRVIKRNREAIEAAYDTSARLAASSGSSPTIDEDSQGEGSRVQPSGRGGRTEGASSDA
jgi:MFS family permease